MIAGENRIFFHVSSKRSSADTDSGRMAENVRKALADVRVMFEATMAKK